MSTASTPTNVVPITKSQATPLTRRMTSREIAELTGKNHHDVLRDIRDLIDQEAIGESNFACSSYMSEQNKKLPMYALDLQATMTLITGYDAKRRSIIIDRWLKLETGEAEPAMLSPQKKADTLAGKYRETETIVRSLLSIGKLLGTAPPMAKANAIAVEDARRLTGVDCAHLLPLADMPELPVGIRKLAELSGIPERKVSTLILEKELATRDASGNVILTEKGKLLKAGSMEPFKSRNSNHSGYQCKWFPSVVIPLLKEVLA